MLNGFGLLIQDATVAFGYYLLHLGHDKLVGFVALNIGIALATLFRFWSYRKFVWVAPPPAEPGTPKAGQGTARRRRGQSRSPMLTGRHDGDGVEAKTTSSVGKVTSAAASLLGATAARFRT